MALTRNPRVAPIITAAALLALHPAVASAEETRATTSTAGAASAYSLDRQHTLVELGIGALTLPSVKLCLETSCTTTDLTLLLSLKHFFKFNRTWGIGAGVSWGFRPTKEDASITTPDGRTIGREHTRNYFMLAGAARYYLIATDGFDFWTGLTAGVIVASDRYAPTQRGESILGPRSTGVVTEGLMGGFGLGADWAFRNNWTVGLWTTQMLWKFPTTKDCAQTRECATVSGTLFSFETGVNVTYRVRL